MKQQETKGLSIPIPGRVAVRLFKAMRQTMKSRKVSWSVVLTEAIEGYLKKVHKL